MLSSLKNHTSSLTALVNMADDGGSTGVLIDELGVLPPGDVRQCLVALSDAPEEVRELFNFRFPKGTFRGHSFGNLFLSAVEKMKGGDFNEAVRLAGDVLRIRGRVLPMTVDKCELICEFGKKKVKGQNKLNDTALPPGAVPKLYYRKQARLNPAAAKAIKHADLIVIAPGNLYASLIPALIIDGAADALRTASAPVAYVCNLVNKPNHTLEYRVHDYAAEIERFLGAGSLDYVLYNIDHPSASLLKKYALDREYPVKVEESRFEDVHYTPVAGSFLSHAHHKRNPNDSFIRRSLIRHDGEAVAEALLKLL